LTLREDIYGKKATPPIPSFFAEYLISRKKKVLVKISATRNYRYPTLNDLYFMPGGNPRLQPEQGVSFDGSLSFSHSGRHVSWKSSIGGFYSRISNWIAWMPTHKGFWSPQNVYLVQSYGTEAFGWLNVPWSSQWKTQAEGNFAWTRSLSEGKQLPYIPRFSGTLTARLLWKDWTLTYDWTYYSKRFTTLDGWQNPLLHELGPYFMNDVALEKKIVLPRVLLHIKAIVRNLFNEEYETVLARPMPGINGTLSIGIVPLFY
ncbi:MAG: TonB-dependent receptor, partial [Bacteroidales bacterium]